MGRRWQQGPQAASVGIHIQTYACHSQLLASLARPFALLVAPGCPFGDNDVFKGNL